MITELADILMGTGIYLLDISFLNFSLLDVLDIAIVSFLFYRVYKLLRGSVAFNIFLGLVTLYLIWWLVNALKMQLLATILSQFASVGVILLVIVFQPEIRSFLIELGQTTFGTRLEPVMRWLNLQSRKPAAKVVTPAENLFEVITGIRDQNGDAVIILNSGAKGNLPMQGGVMLDTELNKDLLYSVLHPESALRQGAVVIEGGRIKGVAVRFPYSESQTLDLKAGPRHRLGVGATETADVGAVIVSSKDQSISTAYQGYLAYDISSSELMRFLQAHT